MRIGFIGVGVINEAFARGVLAQYGAAAEVLLSPRNAARAAALAAKFPNVRVCASNQEVVDGSDWVMLAVLPRIAREVIGALRFRDGQRALSFISDFTLAELRSLAAPATLTRMVPLPFVAHRVGPLAVFPDDPEVTAVFGSLGQIVPAADEPTMDMFTAITALMSAYFAMLGDVVGWAEAKGFPPEAAAGYTASFFEALLYKAKTLTPDELAGHWREMTPGGLNELAVTYMRDTGAISAWSQALDKVWDRIRPAR
ncbi:MAG: NAD(P)-binding domain-containing protein [Propionibacteriaceae bacterium]|nr:NAD(P)-binding domain-containing protein [Propionibacteriaceae bacterium]